MHQNPVNQLEHGMPPTLSVEALNGDCHAALVDRAALQHAMQTQGVLWHGLVTERCQHLFADVPVFISDVQLQQMRAVIAAVERVVNTGEWGVGSGKWGNPLPRPLSRGPRLAPHRQSALAAGSVLPETPLSPRERERGESLGVFYGYDFHLNDEGAHLIEVNTNAGGGFLNALLLDSQRGVELPGVAVAQDDLESVFLAMFRNEWRLARGDAPLTSVAIVDAQPEAQYLYPEFLLAQRLFERAGIAAYIADPAALHSRGDGLYFDGQKIDLVYNRLTDFSLRQHPALHQAYLDDSVLVTPNPAHYARYADKRNLARLSDAVALRVLGACEDDIVVLRAGVPQTRLVEGADAARWWAERKQWFFKPNSGFGSKGSYSGPKLTRRVFDEIMQGGYVAQRMAAPGERMICLEGGVAQPYKYDVRCYVYDGEVQLIAARLYQGQTTNFRTPGGGFAPVRVVG